MAPIIGRSPSPTALLRYRLVGAIKAEMFRGLSRGSAVRLVSEQAHHDLAGEPFSVSRRSLYRWLEAYERAGLMGLEPQSRDPLQGSLVLNPKLLEYLVTEHKLDPRASIPELVNRAREVGRIGPLEEVCRQTVWATFRRLGLPTRPADADLPVKDMRRFRYPERMQMVLVDGKHFRAGPNEAKRVALYFIDDATRYGLDVRVGTSENTLLFLRAFHALLRRYGWMSFLFADNGSAFISEDTVRVLAQLELPLINGTAGYPEGHGGIERFNRSAQARVLGPVRGAPDVDPTSEALTLRLRHDLFEVYNHLPHRTLHGDSPAQRWHASQKALRPVPEDAELATRFTLTEERLVSKDHIVSWDGVAYEVPCGYARQKVVLYRRLLEEHEGRVALYMCHQDRWLKLHPVDLVANAHARRAQGNKCASDPVPGQETEAGRTDGQGASPPRKSASMLNYEKHYGSVLAPDGGFSERSEHADAKESTHNDKELS